MFNINKDMTIGELLDKYPEARKVIQKYFGKHCFNRAGMRMESFALGAMIHGADINEMVREIQQVCEKK